MPKDLSKLLAEWEYEPDSVRVRLIEGDDGRPKIQLRIDLGILQMEFEGRPDGQQPEGRESWLDYYEHQQQIFQAAHPDSPPFLLTEEDCARLWREGVQYYHRYLAFWHLDLFDACARDTARNLRLFSFVRNHASDERHKMQFEQWRPYVTMMHARAVATPLIKQGEHVKAVEAIDEAIDAIRDFLDEHEQGHRAEECIELASLEHWREEIVAESAAAAAAHPPSALQMLRRKLEAAIAAEEFEEAARLRDEIRRQSSETPDDAPPS